MSKNENQTSCFFYEQETNTCARYNRSCVFDGAGTTHESSCEQNGCYRFGSTPDCSCRRITGKCSRCGSRSDTVALRDHVGFVTRNLCLACLKEEGEARDKESLDDDIERYYRKALSLARYWWDRA